MAASADIVSATPVRGHHTPAACWPRSETPRRRTPVGHPDRKADRPVSAIYRERFPAATSGSAEIIVTSEPSVWIVQSARLTGALAVRRRPGSQFVIFSYFVEFASYVLSLMLKSPWTDCRTDGNRKSVYVFHYSYTSEAGSGTCKVLVARSTRKVAQLLNIAKCIEK